MDTLLINFNYLVLIRLENSRDQCFKTKTKSKNSSAKTKNFGLERFQAGS